MRPENIGRPCGADPAGAPAGLDERRERSALANAFDAYRECFGWTIAVDGRRRRVVVRTGGGMSAGHQPRTRASACGDMLDLVSCE
ncbi:hypothetical protein HUW46_01304 [Amycolatopsis sp. CA-230715]|nr:hypothetical protein HUW46_01304 [Amycolatopsis sp. CA-230715]